MLLNHQNGLLLMRYDKLDEREWRSDDCYKVIFSPYGKGVYQTQMGDVSMDTDQFLFFNPDDKHKQLYATKEKFLVEIESSLLKNVAEQLNIDISEPEFALVSYKNAHLLNWASFIREYITVNSGSSHELFLDNSISQLAILMLQYGPGSHLDDLSTPNASENMRRVIDALKESYAEDWTLDQMAVLSGLTKFQFAHLFKDTTGLSPYSWLQLYRLLRSQKLLVHTKSSILTIAMSAGFKNVSSYNNLFKKVYRKTPTEFRMFYRENS